MANWLYQARGTYVSPYNELLRRQTRIGLRRINKSSMLAALDGLREGAVQEHILHIKLLNR
jgi:hypothetical protein